MCSVACQLAIADGLTCEGFRLLQVQINTEKNTAILENLSFRLWQRPDHEMVSGVLPLLLVVVSRGGAIFILLDLCKIRKNLKKQKHKSSETRYCAKFQPFVTSIIQKYSKIHFMIHFANISRSLEKVLTLTLGQLFPYFFYFFFQNFKVKENQIKKDKIQELLSHHCKSTLIFEPSNIVKWSTPCPTTPQTFWTESLFLLIRTQASPPASLGHPRCAPGCCRLTPTQQAGWQWTPTYSGPKKVQFEPYRLTTMIFQT